MRLWAAAVRESWEPGDLETAVRGRGCVQAGSVSSGNFIKN